VEDDSGRVDDPAERGVDEVVHGGLHLVVDRFRRGFVAEDGAAGFVKSAADLIDDDGAEAVENEIH